MTDKMRGLASHFIYLQEVPKMKEIHLKSYAKVNLSLDVSSAREDGFHELSTVMHRISLFDRIHIQWIPDQEKDEITIQLQTNRPYLPTDERNLAYKAAQIIADRYAGSSVGGGTLLINITKSIPVAAGLAGGSGNGAAVLIGLNRLWELKLNTKQLCKISEELGSDLPFCVLVQNTRYKAALATGRGEILHPLRTSMKKHIVLAKPPFGVSTKEVFKGIDEYEITERPDNDELIKGLSSGRDDLIYGNMINVLELYTLEHYEPVKKLKEIMRTQTDAQYVLMSGSGPTVFGIYSSEKQARKACNMLRKMRYEAYWASTDGR